LWRNHDMSQATPLSTRLRYSVLLHILGLDERWSASAQLRSCHLVVEALDALLTDTGDSAQSVGDPSISAPLSLSGATGTSPNRSGPLEPAPRDDLKPGASPVALGIDTSVAVDSTVHDDCALYPIAEGGLVSRRDLLKLSRKFQGNLPSDLRPRLRFSSSKNGFDLSSLLQVSCTCGRHMGGADQAHLSPYKSFLLLIAEDTGYVFGAYINDRICEQEQLFGLEGTSVFTVTPAVAVYPCTTR